MSRITKTAIDKTESQTPALFYPSAREGFQDLLANGSISDRPNVLLPAYIGQSPREGSGVFDPIRNLGLQARFYDLNQDLTVDLSKLEYALSSYDCDVLVVIHYFGRTNTNLSDIRRLTHKYGVTLLEDLAHGFFSAQGDGHAGKFGDVCLYSLHKMFPMPSGGLIVYRNPDLIAGQRSVAPEMAAEVLSYDWRAISALRRSNFEFLSQALSRCPETGTQFELLWSELDAHDVPQSLPVRIIDGDRDEVYEKMNASGFGMVSLYHTLIGEIPGGFAEMRRISDQLINFPVHQDASDDQFQPMIDCFREALKG